MNHPTSKAFNANPAWASGQSFRRRAQPRHYSSAMVDIGHQLLAALDAEPRSYELTYYAVRPEQLGGGVEIPSGGKVLVHRDIRGKTLHLNEDARHATIAAASYAFTGPFMAVVRRREHAASSVAHAMVIAGVSLQQSAVLMGSLGIVEAAHRLKGVNFAGLLGLSAAEGEWMAQDRDEMQKVLADFQMRVEAEAVVVSGAHMVELER